MQPQTPIRLAVALLALLALTTTRAADFQPMAPVYAAIHSLLKQKLDQNIKNPKITIREVGQRTRMPRCQTPLNYRLLQPERVDTGRHTVIVECKSPRWKLFISAQVSGLRPIVISTALIPRHSLINPEQVHRQFIDSRQIPKGVLTDPEQAVGMRARRAIAPNTPIKAQMLLPPYWVHKGKPVTIIARIGTVEVKARGVATKSAVENELVAVKNLRSGKTVRAIVIAPNTVLVP